ncbi:uncharacterized protein LOC113231045 isoform X2 [Hyposmocoma kahamanoa]|uniref:uncharacterized protein LOC113231045 isoform X2 n=1 Tax=Hyposmocoma kahamanoa TaxID=1477025 RepID=UPI000E6D7D7D|nr:uncharacterized protein LOC113231045 isoform X2 [Hyposmocoma kahamanoa]
MEPFGDTNCNSMSDRLSLYERYLRSFNVVDSFVSENRDGDQETHREYDSSCDGNVHLPVNKHYEVDIECNPSRIDENIDIDRPLNLEGDYCKDSRPSPGPSLLENSSATAEHSTFTEKSNNTDIPVSSDDSKPDCFKQPIFITSTMENSNNAVDSVPLFRDVRPSESVFKLPISELSFNGTIKHIQKLKPIVDPITELTTRIALDKEEKSQSLQQSIFDNDSNVAIELDKNSTSEKSNISSTSSDTSKTLVEKTNDSTGDSQYEECNKNGQSVVNEDSVKWNSDQSYSSLEASFDSGVRSPDMFSDGDDDREIQEAPAPFWAFLKDVETFDRRRVRKLEETLQGVLPPPSVTTVKLDVTDMLKKYYCFLPAFQESTKVAEPSTTPSKRVSFVHIPEIMYKSEVTTEIKTENHAEVLDKHSVDVEKSDDSKVNSISKEIKSELDTSADKTIDLKMCCEIEAKESAWPEALKCRYHDVYYNLTPYSEKFELLALRYGERYVGVETDTSVNVHSGSSQSPSSASKRRALRLKLAQTKSPGRRLSHLARRRQAFCNAATISEKAHSSTAKMVYIDKKKLISSAERKSPRYRRTPGKKTPTRKTPGKKTPGKTPKSSTKKKAMRRLIMDENRSQSEHVTRSQPRENFIKRALFISPENRKSVPQAPCTSVPTQAMKSRRALFGSPITAETKSSDGTQSDQFLKRKRSFDDVGENNRSKIAKSLSFGGDSIGTEQSSTLYRRSSEVFASKNSVDLNETHKKKLLWAVSEALRVHGWRMSSPGFREKASCLARLTRRLLTLPPHAARFAAPKASTSETMLKLARQYVFAIIQGRSVEDCFQEEQMKIANESSKVTGYISATAYQQLKSKASTSSFTSQIKENYVVNVKQEQPRSASKNILQDKLVNIDSSSNSSSGMSMIDRMDKSALFKSNSMPSFEEAAKMRAKRQISFDNVEFPKR